ncbi:MAG TPA: S9 family peptidase [Phycisphaerales bacterium]|nr:S9 family peptidase [Phycisphaerales bacterium]
MRCAIVWLVLTSLAWSQPGADTHGITLERIMSDPEWIGLFPEEAYWADDSGGVYFQRKRQGSELRDLVYKDVSTGEERVLGDIERALADARGGRFDPDRIHKVFARNGDVFIHDLISDLTIQLTRTNATERSPAFMLDTSQIMFRRSGDWFVLDTENGSVAQVADVRFEDEPDGDQNEEDGYIDLQQEKLFSSIRQEQEQRKARRDLREAIERADPTRVPGPFYIGRDLHLVDSALSPSGGWLAVVASADEDEARRDVLTRFVTEDGYAQTRSVRPKVGVGAASGNQLFIIDLRRERVFKIDLRDLPGIEADPLFFLREDDRPLEAPRPVRLRDLKWDATGHRLMFQAWSVDHKDRWIAVLDVSGGGVDQWEPKLRSVHRDHDPAWVNWRVGEADWNVNGEGLWFLSEESGYSHLYLWDGYGSQADQVTDGNFEIWDVVELNEGGIFLARTNRTDPAVYEVDRVDVDADTITSVTHFGAEVESFAVSADGTRLLLEVSSWDHPAELFIVDVDGANEATQVTHSVSEAFQSYPWIEPEIVDIPLRGGLSARARVYQFGNGAGRPGVLFVHGAGYLQNVDRGWTYYFREAMFHSLLAYEGYVVVDLDYRASAGYGRGWRTAIYRHMGGPELDDMVDAARWMTEQRGVDADRIGVYGGSYGGFLSIMAVFKEPEVFRCGAALRPVTDWAHYNHGYTSAILNTPDIDPEAYERSSPIEFAEGFVGGLLICHGMLDDNVLVEDTIRLQQRLIELKKQDWDVALYPMESHSFHDPAAWLDEYRRIHRLFERWISPAG